MAATRLIALHINKGKTVAQCLADRTDYSENAAKTEDGKYISACHHPNISCSQLSRDLFLQLSSQRQNA